MSKKEFYKSLPLINDDGFECFIKYYVLKNSDDKSSCYGISIEKTIEEDGINSVLEHDAVEKIVDNQNEILKIIKKLSDFLVLPIHLVDVIDDYIS